MSSERRTAAQAAVASLLAAAAAFGFITAEESQTYGVASVALIGAISSVITAVATWRQRGDQAELQQNRDDSESELG